jgi:hypothetical protein
VRYFDGNEETLEKFLYVFRKGVTMIARVVSEIVAPLISIGVGLIGTILLSSYCGSVAGPIGMLAGAGVGLITYSLLRWFW